MGALAPQQPRVKRHVSGAHEVRRVTNAIHLRSVAARADVSSNGSGRQGVSSSSEDESSSAKRLDSPADKPTSRPQASNDMSGLRTYDIAEGEALESARADSELQSEAFTSARGGSPPGESGVPDSPGSSRQESLDPELYEVELSSFDNEERDSPSPQTSTSISQPASDSVPQDSAHTSAFASSDSSSTSATSAPSSTAAAPPSLLRSQSLSSTTTAGSSRPAYRPRSALSLARRRMVSKYFPFKWQQDLRRRAEEIPEQQFNYLLSTAVIAGTALASGIAAYFLWPFARDVVNFVFSADAVEARVLQELTFETQYLAAISLVTAILFGNTFAFSFDRQRQIIQEMAEEVFALELLLQELFIDIPEPHLRWRVIKHIKRYIENEIQARDIDSPFRVDGAIMGLFDALLTLKGEGRNIAKLLVTVEMLAQANSRRGALAAALLPPLHWVMLGALCMLLLTAFLLFDSDFSNPVAENRTIFAVLSAMLVTILNVLRDISSPDDGLYSVRDAMETRLTYVRWQMDNILSDPTIKVSMIGKEGEVEAAEDSIDEDESANAVPAWMKEDL